MLSNRFVSVALFMFLSHIGLSVYAYELATHGSLTYNGYKHSSLNDTLLLRELGLRDKNSFFGIFYHDVTGSDVKERTRQEFEGAIIQELGVNPLSLEGWLMRGAIREDDWVGVSIPGVCYAEAPNPDDDPYGDVIRPLNHFYDRYQRQTAFLFVRS